MFDIAEVVARAASAARVARYLPGLRSSENEVLASIRRYKTLEQTQGAADQVAARPQPPDQTDGSGAGPDSGTEMSTVDGDGFFGGLIEWLTDHF